MSSPLPLRRPRSLRNCRRILVSSGTSSSSPSAANALPAPNAIAMMNVTAAAKRRGPIGCRFRMGYPLPATAECAVSPRSFWPGSGRFCGAVPDQGLVKEPDHPGDDGHVGEVEDVPVVPAPPDLQVEQGEIHHPRPMQPIGGVADRPADDEAERERGEPRGGPGEPNPQQRDRDRLE